MDILQELGIEKWYQFYKIYRIYPYFTVWDWFGLIRIFIAYNLLISGIIYVCHYQFVNITLKRWTKRSYRKAIIMSLIVAYFSLPAIMWAHGVYDPPEISGITYQPSVGEKIIVYLGFGSLLFWGLRSYLKGMEETYNFRMYESPSAKKRFSKYKELVRKKAKNENLLMSEEEIDNEAEEMIIKRELLIWRIFAWTVMGTVLLVFFPPIMVIWGLFL